MYQCIKIYIHLYINSSIHQYINIYISNYTVPPYTPQYNLISRRSHERDQRARPKGLFLHPHPPQPQPQVLQRHTRFRANPRSSLQLLLPQIPPGYQYLRPALLLESGHSLSLTQGKVRLSRSFLHKLPQDHAQGKKIQTQRRQIRLPSVHAGSQLSVEIASAQDAQDVFRA